jgi:hypothetical protein
MISVKFATDGRKLLHVFKVADWGDDLSQIKDRWLEIVDCFQSQKAFAGACRPQRGPSVRSLGGAVAPMPATPIAGTHQGVECLAAVTGQNASCATNCWEFSLHHGTSSGWSSMKADSALRGRETNAGG